MDQNIKCCEVFKEIMYHFEWNTYKSETGALIYCMPYIFGKDETVMYRINNYPSCGKDIRSIKLTQVN